MSNLGERFNEGKLKWSMVDFKSLEPMVRVLEFGAKKYSVDNWKKGLDPKEVLESLLRHAFAISDGEEFDPESGLSHIGHIQCNAMFLEFMSKKHEWKTEAVTKHVAIAIFNRGGAVYAVHEDGSERLCEDMEIFEETWDRFVVEI